MVEALLRREGAFGVECFPVVVDDVVAALRQRRQPVGRRRHRHQQVGVGGRGLRCQRQRASRRYCQRKYLYQSFHWSLYGVSCVGRCLLTRGPLFAVSCVGRCLLTSGPLFGVSWLSLLVKIECTLLFQPTKLIKLFDYIFEENNIDTDAIISIADHDYLWGKDVDEPFVYIKNLKITKDMIQLLKNTTIKISLPNNCSIIKFGTDEELEYGQEGELCATGPSIMLKYLNNPILNLT